MKQPLRSKIMGGIYAVYLLRKAYSATAIKAYVLGISLGAMAFAVSLAHIVENALRVKGITGLFDFAASAVLNTEMSVQLLLITAALAFVLMVRDLQSLSRTRVLATR